jgi:toxin ParE1/3/4
MDYQVVLSGSARSDIRDIVRYISVEDPQQGLSFGRFLLRHARSLGQFPLRGRAVPEFEDENIRELIAKAYRIVYRLNHDEHLIEVIRFWHAGRGTPEILM